MYNHFQSVWQYRLVGDPLWARPNIDVHARPGHEAWLGVERRGDRLRKEWDIDALPWLHDLVSAGPSSGRG
jgi:hypothetical protein